MLYDEFDYASLSVGVLGSTGSVGKQALDVVRAHHIKLLCISAKNNVAEAEAQIREFSPVAAAMADEESARLLRIAVKDTNTKVYGGPAGITEMIKDCHADIYVNAILGVAGLPATMAIIETGKRCALSNKESLVVAGNLVMEKASALGSEIIPVDSEHSAIFQAIGSNPPKAVKKILLTASGGPFFGYTKEMLSRVTKKEALAHPTWKMGEKITVDSATLMNKGFEVIEAVHLFHVKPEQIEVLVHRESIIHSMVEYIDNTVLAELSAPDMSLCVQYAITYPQRTTSITPELNFSAIGSLTFHQPDTATFPLLKLAYRAISSTSPAPCAMNAANEVAVAAFLREEVGLFETMESVQAVTERFLSLAPAGSLAELDEIDASARRYTQEYLSDIKQRK